MFGANLSKNSRKFFIETVDVMVTGSARPMVQDVAAGDKITDFWFEKLFVSMLGKKYNENLAKFQGHALPGVSKVDTRSARRIREKDPGEITSSKTRVPLLDPREDNLH